MPHINPAKGDFDIVRAGNRAKRWHVAKQQGVSLFAFNTMEKADAAKNAAAVAAVVKSIESQKAAK